MLVSMRSCNVHSGWAVPSGCSRLCHEPESWQEIVDLKRQKNIDVCFKNKMCETQAYRVSLIKQPPTCCANIGVKADGTSTIQRTGTIEELSRSLFSKSRLYNPGWRWIARFFLYEVSTGHSSIANGEDSHSCIFMLPYSNLFHMPRLTEGLQSREQERCRGAILDWDVVWCTLDKGKFT